MKDLISVIIPSRATEKNETLTSLKKQTYKDYELIEIIDKNCKGASWARNQGLKKATGKFIFFCDNDIRLEPDCLENLYKTLEANKDCDWAFGRFIIDGEGYNLNKKPNEANIYSKEFIDYFFGISTMSLIRATAKPRFDERLKRFDDWDLWIRLTRAGHKPAFCDEHLFETEYSKTGVSSGDPKKDKEILYKKHLNKIADIVIPHHSQHKMLAECISRIDNKIFNIIIVSGGTFAENCNKGARLATTDSIIFLNDDTEPTNDILIAMVEDKHDITGIAQYIPSVHSTRYGIGFNRETFERFLSATIEDTFMPSGFCFKVKTKAWIKLGGLDEIFKNGAEDIDLFFRAIKQKIKFGYLIESIPHFLSKSEGRFLHAGENDKILEKRWKGKLLLKRFSKKKAKEQDSFDGKGATATSDFYFKGRLIKKYDYVNIPKDKFMAFKEAGLITNL